MFDKKLYLEGLAREMVRRIQSMRKDANLDYTDRIYRRIEGDESLMEAFSLVMVLPSTVTVPDFLNSSWFSLLPFLLEM